MKASKLKFILLFYDDVSIIFDEFFTTNHPIRLSERLMNIMISIITFYNPFFLISNMPLSTDRRNKDDKDKRRQDERSTPPVQ